MLDEFDAVTKSEVPDGAETSMSESLDKDCLLYTSDAADE